MPKGKGQVVTMKQDKVCKSCIRYRGEGAQADDIASSIYVQNKAYEAMGKPKSITVTIAPA